MKIFLNYIVIPTIVVIEVIGVSKLYPICENSIWKFIYVVKNEENEILFYFSLKCGMLYDDFIDEKSLKLLNKLMDIKPG